MASSINASTSGAGGVITTADNTGILNLQTASTTAVTVDASQNVTVAGNTYLATSSGSVGIGTTSPNKTLEVKNGADYQIRMNNGTSAQSYDMGRSTSTGIFTFYGNQTGFTGYSFSGVDGESMRIAPDGTVRMNCANYATGPSSTSNGIALEKNGGFPFWNHANTGTGLTTYHAFINGNGVVGTIRTTGSSTQYNTSSDYRLKEDIQPMVGALDKVARLNPVTYKWKVDGTDGQGFIAHELAEVVPECVSGKKDAVNEDGSINPQGIDTSHLAATLTAAIQEQQTIINDLKARIETLEAK